MHRTVDYVHVYLQAACQQRTEPVRERGLVDEGMIAGRCWPEQVEKGCKDLPSINTQIGARHISTCVAEQVNHSAL